MVGGVEREFLLGIRKVSEEWWELSLIFEVRRESVGLWILWVCVEYLY